MKKYRKIAIGTGFLIAGLMWWKYNKNHGIVSLVLDRKKQPAPAKA